MPPTGYLVKRGGRLVPDPERAPAIRQLFHDYLTMSANELGRRLEATGFKTFGFASRSGAKLKRQKFPCQTILKILRNPLYAGYFERNRELVESTIEPLVTLEQWQQVQELIRSRHPCVRDPVANPLTGLLHDELGRRMHVIKGGGGRKGPRYYVSDAVGWARGYGVKRVHVRSDQVEELTKSTLQAFFADRRAIRETILSLGLYSNEVAAVLRRGQLAARRLSLMENEQLREFLLAVVYRADVNRSYLRLLVCNYEVYRFVGWDGVGVFKKADVRPKGADRFRMLYAPSCLICTRPEHAIPIQPKPAACNLSPSARLVGLLEEAADLRHFTLANRGRSLSELAKEKKLGSKHFARIMRLNYLAPDIQAAIMDGSQPPDLTSSKLVFSPLPLDWEQQRRLFGFPSPTP
jgi:hypothetical protein